MSEFKNILPAPSCRLTVSEKNVFDYLDDYEHDEFTISQNELAHITFSSDATISRVIKKLGFHSYKEFSIWFNQTLASFKEKVVKVNEVDGKGKLQNLLYMHKYMFEDGITNDIVTSCEKAAKLIVEAKRIYTFGFGTSLRIATELSVNLSRMKLAVSTFHDFHSFLPVIGNADEDDLFIFFSNSFENQEIIFSIKKINSKAKVVVITSNKFVKLERNITQTIIYNNLEKDSFAVPFSSKQAQYLIIDLLFIMTLELLPPEVEKMIKKGQLTIEEWEHQLIKNY